MPFSIQVGTDAASTIASPLLDHGPSSELTFVFVMQVRKASVSSVGTWSVGREFIQNEGVVKRAGDMIISILGARYLFLRRL